MMRLRPAADAEAAAWVVAGLRGFAESVFSVVPAGFPVYVRVFHPAYRLQAGNKFTPVTWSEIAAATAKVVHPGMQFGPFTGEPTDLHAPLPGVFEIAPTVGSLPPELATPSAAALARHTSTPDRCWFAVWHGFAGLDDVVHEAPMFERPAREYYLLTGPCEAVIDLDPRPFTGRLPNLWWPEDRAWCVSTEVDFSTTYVGCDEPCRDELLSLRAIEALEIDPSTGITYNSDLVNPLDEPERSS